MTQIHRLSILAAISVLLLQIVRDLNRFGRARRVAENGTKWSIPSENRAGTFTSLAAVRAAFSGLLAPRAGLVARLLIYIEAHGCGFRGKWEGAWVKVTAGTQRSHVPLYVCLRLLYATLSSLILHTPLSANFLPSRP